MSIATAIELFNHPIITPSNVGNNQNKNHNKPNSANVSDIDTLHQNAIFGTASISPSKNAKNSDKTKTDTNETNNNKPQTEFSLSNIWAHNEKLLNTLNNINNRVLNGASININNHSFFKCIYAYLSSQNNFDISIALAIMKLLYNISDMYPHTIAYILSANIPFIILQILKAGFKSYNPDEFTLHIEYINVLEYLTRYAYSHSLVLTRTSNNEHYFGHSQDTQTSKKTVRHLMDISLNHKSGIIDCILCNLSLHDKKDSIKAIGILAQIFALCLDNNTSCPTYLRRERSVISNESESDSEGEGETEERSEDVIMERRDKVLQCLSAEVVMHCEYLCNCLKHNFSEMQMLENILCFVSNFTQILLFHNAFDALMQIFNTKFVGELMQFCLRCYSVIVQYQSRSNSVDSDGDSKERMDCDNANSDSDSNETMNDGQNSKYCQFVVIVLRILHQLLHIEKLKDIHRFLMYDCHIERLYSDLVIECSNNNPKKLSVIRIGDTSLLETIIVLGQTLNNKLDKNNGLMTNLMCILVEYGRNIDNNCINLILHSLNVLLTDSLLKMAGNKENQSFVNDIYHKNNEKICELISFILEKNHETNHLNVVLLKLILQILLDWYEFTKMLKSNEKIMEMRQNLKKYGADLMITHWRKLLKERYPNYRTSESKNNELKQVKTVMIIIRKCLRILDIDSEMDTDSDSSESESEESDIELVYKKDKNKKSKFRIFDRDELDVMADDTYFDHITLHLSELLKSTNITTADHLKKLGEMLLNMTRTDSRICHKLCNGSVSNAEYNKLFMEISIDTLDNNEEDKYSKYWRLYSLHIQRIIEERDCYNHFRILLCIKCLLNEAHLTKYQFISSGIIDILLYYLTVTDTEMGSVSPMKKSRISNTQKQKKNNLQRIKMDLLHDRQRLFAFVFFFDLNEKYLQIHLCQPMIYKQILKYTNQFVTNNSQQQSMKYLIQLLLQSINMDIFPVRTVKTAQNNESNTNEDIVMNSNNTNTNNKKHFSFGAGNKSQQIDKYYYELKLLSERVLMINVFHDIDHCVVAESLRFNYKHQLLQWENTQKLRKQQMEDTLRKKKTEKVESNDSDSDETLLIEDSEGNEDNPDNEGNNKKREWSNTFAFERKNKNSPDNDSSNNDGHALFPPIPQLKNRHKQKIKLPTNASWGTPSSNSSFPSPESAPYNPIRAVNFSVTGHLFMTVSDITKVFITKYEALRKYKYKNPTHLLTDIANDKLDRSETNCIDMSSFLIHNCGNPQILSHFMDTNDNECKEDMASIRAAQLLQNGLELVVTYNGIELPKHLTVLQVLLIFDYPHLFNDFNDYKSDMQCLNAKTIEDITEIRQMERDEENEFAYRASYSKRDRHVFNIYFRWKQQNRTKPTHVMHMQRDNHSDSESKLQDLINPTRYLDNISYRLPTLLPEIPLHTHRTRSSSRRQTIASTSSLLLNSPPSSPSNDIVMSTHKKRRGKKRKFSKMEADTHSNSNSYSISLTPCAKKRKIAHSNGTIHCPNSTGLSEQHFPQIPRKWYESIANESVKICDTSKWKTDGPTLIILKLLNYFHGFSSHWSSLYFDDFYDIENVFNFNKQFDINKVKMKYIYNDQNNEDDQKFANKDDIQCLLKPHIFYNSQLIDRLKTQIEQIFVTIAHMNNDWIKEIPLKYPFLFPYHIRKDIFDIFSFGPTRALKNLVTFLKKCHHNSDSANPDTNTHTHAPFINGSALNLNTQMRQTNILNIPSMSPLFTVEQKENTDLDMQISTQIQRNASSNHTFSMIYSLLTNDNCMIPKEHVKTVKIHRSSVLSDVCNLFYASKYHSPLLAYYHFQTFRYHTAAAMPSDSFRDELALHLLPDPERISSMSVSRPRHNHRIRNVNFNQTNHNSTMDSIESQSESATPAPPQLLPIPRSKKRKKRKRKESETSAKAPLVIPVKKKRKISKKAKKKSAENELQLQYLPIVSEGVIDFNYDCDPFTTHFSESILRVQFYGDDGVGTGPTMEFFTMATKGLDRQDLQLWIDDDTHINSVNMSETHNINGTSEALYAFGVHRCSDCTLINGLLCCPMHKNKPLICYKNRNERGNISLQSCVDELFYCDESECEYHCHSNNKYQQMHSDNQCRFCGDKCEIYFWVISEKALKSLYESYPMNINCISHPLMQCDCCKIVSFAQSNKELLVYALGGVYDGEGRSYPIHYLSSAHCFSEHCHPFCYRSDITMTPVLITKTFVTELYDCIVTQKKVKSLDLKHYQNIVSLSSAKSRKMKILGRENAFLTGNEASIYKSKDSLVSFICPTNDSLVSNKKEESESNESASDITIRNQMSHVTGYNGLFYRPNVLSFIRNSPFNNNCDKYFDVLGKIMILAIKEDKRMNLELHKMFFKFILHKGNSDVTILDMLKIYPNDHYLMILFRLFNIYKLYRKISTYSTIFNDANDSNGKGSQHIIALKSKCESFIDLLCLTLNTPMFNVNLSKTKEFESLSRNNLEKYLIGICDYFLNNGIAQMNKSVTFGLQSMVLPFENGLFLPFYDYELETLTIGSNTQHFNEWTPKYLRKYVKLEQYSYNTPVIQNLYEILCNEFDIKQKRQFIRFLTGSLSLPLGGISKLNPQFTITKYSTPEQQFLYENAEYESLPHATTCRHTLRLPPYKHKTTLKHKLLQAMNHAQTGFYLS